MKSFTVFIAATIVAAASAINEPVASPVAAVERELAEYERQLGTDITGTPTVTPPRPTSGVSAICLVILWQLAAPLFVICSIAGAG
jgi:hypothetical protein